MLDLQERGDTMGMLFKNKTKINSVIAIPLSFVRLTLSKAEDDKDLSYGEGKQC